MVELRQALANGLLSDAESIGARARELLQKASVASATREQFNQSLGWMLDAISLAVSGDHRTAMALLDRVTSKTTDNESLRWAAWLWSCWAALGLEQVDLARTAASHAVELSSEFDTHCRSISLCAKAEVSASVGDREEAVKQLTRAEDGDPTVCMFQARILADIDYQDEAEVVAMRAMDLAPDWVEPPLFLATLALMQGNLDVAEKRLADLQQLGPWPQEAHRLNSLLHFVRSDWAPLQVVIDYLHLRDAPASDSVIEELQTMMFYAPVLYHLREELAWQLLKVGRYDAGQEHFEALAEQELDPAVHASVQLGLSSLASLRKRSMPPGAQVHAATQASRPTPMEMPAVSCDPEPRSQTDPRWVQHALTSVAGKRPAFSGDLRILSLPDLLEFLRNGRRSGTLVLQSPKGTGAVYLRGGLVTNAAAPGCINIGDLLVQKGAVTPEQLRQVASSRHDDRGSLLGSIFVERGLVQAEVMKEALSDQVFAAIRDLFVWNEGQFAFLPDNVIREGSAVEIELDPQILLLEVARQLDEENR